MKKVETTCNASTLLSQGNGPRGDCSPDGSEPPKRVWPSGQAPCRACNGRGVISTVRGLEACDAGCDDGVVRVLA